MNQSIEDNIEQIVALIKEARTYDGYKMSRDADIHINQIRQDLIQLSDGALDLYREANNSNVRIGMYKITLNCVYDIEDYINQHYGDMNES